MPNYSVPSGYLYAAGVTVTGGNAAVTGSTSVPTTSGTDYVVQLRLTGSTASTVYSELTDTAAFSDVSMWWWNGTSWVQIDCDIDQKTNGAWSSGNISLWFKLQAALSASPATDANYMLAWGKQSGGSITTKQSWANIYPFSDDFLGTSLSANWTTSGSPTVSVASSIVSISFASQVNLLAALYTSGITYGDGYVAAWCAKLPIPPNTSCLSSVAFRSGNDWTDYFQLESTTTNDKAEVLQAGAQVASSPIDLGVVSDNAYHVYTIARDPNGTAAYFSIDGDARTSLTWATADTTAKSTQLTAFNGSTTVTASVTSLADWVKVRPFVATEPVTTLGSIITVGSITGSAGASGSVAPTIALASVVQTDTFTRANQTGGWGTASDTEAWTLGSGSSSNVQILSNEGNVYSASGSVTNVMLLDSKTTLDSEALVRWSVHSGSTDSVHAVLRAQTASNFYAIGFSSTNLATISKVVSGSLTTLASTAYTPTADAFNWLRARVVGNWLYCKVWADGSAEPAGWTLSYQDTGNTFSTAGLSGLRGVAANATGVKVDSLTVSDLSLALHGAAGGGSGGSATGVTTGGALLGAGGASGSSAVTLKVPANAGGGAGGSAAAVSALTTVSASATGAAGASGVLSAAARRAPWVSVTITVGGVDVTQYVPFESVTITASISQRMSTCQFELIDPDARISARSKQDIKISDGTTTWFGGLVGQIDKHSDTKVRLWTVYGQGYASLLDTTAVNRVYDNMTDAQIVADLLSFYGTGIIPVSTAIATSVDHIAFPYMTLRDCLNTLCNYCSTAYWVDGDHTLHYITPSVQNTPIVSSFSDQPDNVTSFPYDGWKCVEDGTQLQNRVIMVGGQFAAQPITDTFVGNGTTTVFGLSKMPQQLTSCKVGVVAVQTGQAGIDNFGDQVGTGSSTATITALVDSQGQTIRFQTAPANAAAIVVSYTFTLPALARVHDLASFAQYERYYESIMPDASLLSLQAVIDRGRSMLDQYAFPILNGTLTTRYVRVQAGDVVAISNSIDAIAGTFLVTDVQYTFAGNGTLISKLVFVGSVTVTTPGVAMAGAAVTGFIGTSLYTAGAGVAVTTPMPTGVGGNWRLVFSDDFSGSNLDTTKWNTANWWAEADGGSFNSGDGSVSYTLPSQVSVHDGVLDLRANNQTYTDSNGTTYNYVSGMVSTNRVSGQNTSKFAYTYGFMEMRAKLPAGWGFWPGFWMVADNHNWPPEIDAMESNGGTPSDLTLTIHWQNPDNSYGQSSTTYENLAIDYTADYHVYGLNWQPGQVTWYIDGVARKTFSVASEIASVPMNVQVSLEVNGNSGWAPNANTVFPGHMLVDYVRVWQ